MNVPLVISVVAALIGSAAALVAVYKVAQRVSNVDRKIETVNGRSLGVLAELSEGRRIRDTVPEEDRTVREQVYVALLETVERRGSAEELAEDVVLRSQGLPPEGPREET